jgi:hypothetical protein
MITKPLWGFVTLQGKDLASLQFESVTKFSGN